MITIALSYNVFLRDTRVRPYALDIVSQTDDRWERINLALDFVEDNVEYVTDYEQYGLDEKWQWPWETLESGFGDCEDEALLLTRLLLDMNENAHSTYGRYLPTQLFHVWTELIYDGQKYILDPVMRDERDMILFEEKHIYGYNPKFEIYPYYTILLIGNLRIPIPRIRPNALWLARTSFSGDLAWAAGGKRWAYRNYV